MVMARRSLIKLHWLLSSQIGIDPRRMLRSVRGVPRFLSDWWQFRQGHQGTLLWMPCLHDRFEEAGVTRSEYFWQDLIVARRIHDAKPDKHVDVGSRIDGFVAHVASFRDIEVFDVRPMSTSIPNVHFKVADLMQRASEANGAGYCDSVSCLHVLEHFGLGRYGDPIDPHGHEKGIANLAALLKPGGTLYLSTPIGRERVEFNANRVFDPRTIIRLGEANGMTLRDLTIVQSDGSVNEVEPDAESLRALAEAPYNLGIFTFERGPGKAAQ